MTITLKELFLGELDREAKTTRRLLEQVPEGKADWKPHEKSMPFGYLATLVATLPSWTVFTIDRDELDIRPVGGEPYKSPEYKTTAELVAGFDKNVADAKKALENTTDEHLMKPWAFFVAGQKISEDPRYIVLRDTVLNHLMHHRGQLSVYLRLLEAKVTSLYGPTADEPFFGGASS